MLEIVELTKKFGKKVTAVKNVSFKLNPGELCVLLGPNGAGKSTTIKSIAALLRFEGHIYIDSFENRSIEAKKILSYVPEIPALYDLLTVKEHIEFIYKAYKIAYDEERVEELLNRFDMTDKVDKLGSDLSKGMKQKLSIILGVITNPKVILFDEPMVGLDPKAIKELKKLLKELTDSGSVILLSTHIIDSIDENYNRVIIMNEGEFVANYSEPEVSAMNGTLEDLFFRLTQGDYGIEVQEVQ